MKVCVVTTAFPRWIGDGDGVFVWEMVRALVQQGLQVCVVAAHSPGVPSRATIDGIEILRPRYWWPERWEMLRKERGGLPVTWRKYPLIRVQIIPFLLVHALATIRCARFCTLIHAHWTLSAGAACLGRWLHRRPIVATVQGSDILQVPRHPLGAKLTRVVLSCCDRITALSRALAVRILELGIDSEKVKIIPNGVDITRFCPQEERQREDIILFVGSLIERKGVRYLLQAMPKVFRAFPEYRLVIIGDGPQSPLLKQLAAALGIEERVLFMGSQTHDQVRDWMQRAKLLVLPSLEEGMGVVLVEALACATPAVASCVDGIPDVITPDVGVLVPPADPEALSESICEILSDHTRWSVLSRNARERAVEYYSWDKIIQQFINIYQSIS